MHIILSFFELDLIFLLFHFGVEVAFGAGLKELSLIMLVSLSSLLQSFAKELYIYSSVIRQELKPLSKNDGKLHEGHIQVRLLFRQ